MNVEAGGLKTERDDMEFAHQYFVKDQEQLLEHIKRKVGNTVSFLIQTTSTSIILHSVHPDCLLVP